MKGNFKKALEFASKSDAYRSKEKGGFGRALNLVLYGEIYNSMGKTDLAIGYFMRCLDKCAGLGYKDLIRYSYLKLTELYEQKNDYKKALEYQKRFISYKDSL